ncbi:uncharacterized protein MELLADRAFT_68085 [Melampsora larici-populina 98AG31]|uniref:Uncharacterized protein n=1 Tax=Melampsora larici-populina (strain 98AG31 / pathotype 3-4-7) TaxID=747676 RepID=F4S5I9_MELLP|nr:uncharacterized protein MELLADRAFT_68085 [Melampsora larici-populina 98AG31]EGG00098.1 hypothetical protein MELLADRAFT_68085 [Melampsora larici-populina 98AG31]
MDAITSNTRTAQSNTTKLIDTEINEVQPTSTFPAETSQKPYNRTRGKLNQKTKPPSSSTNVTPHQLVVNPTTSHKQTIMYSSSLTALSNNEDCLRSLFKTSSPESPPFRHKYLSESTLADLGELEGIVFEPQPEPSFINKSTPYASFPSNSTNAHREVTDDKINLIYLGGDDLVQAQDIEEANFPVPQLSNKKGSCKCGCHEEMLVLKERIQKSEDLVFPEFCAIPPCCAAIISELP